MLQLNWFGSVEAAQDIYVMVEIKGISFYLRT